MKTQGFTLIEVLIALAILSIALTAIIKSTTQNINDTRYLQQKTIANWVSQLVMNRALSGVLKLNASTDGDSATTDMLGQKWPWKASLTTTPNPHINKIHVTVYDNNQKTLANLESYLYVDDTK